MRHWPLEGGLRLGPPSSSLLVLGALVSRFSAGHVLRTEGDPDRGRHARATWGTWSVLTYGGHRIWGDPAPQTGAHNPWTTKDRDADGAGLALGHQRRVLLGSDGT